MKPTIYKGTVSMLLFSMLISLPFSIQAQIDPNAMIDLPVGGSIDLPMEGGGIDLPGDGVLDALSEPSDLLGSDNQTESGPELPGDDPGVPVDGGVGFLLAAGLGYGANKLRKYKQEKRKADK